MRSHGTRPIGAAISISVGVVESDAALGSAEKGLRRPKADDLPAASKPVDAIRAALKVLKRDAGCARASPRHKRAKYAKSLRVEPTKALTVPVIHPESGQVPQRVQVSIPVVSLINHTLLPILPSVLP